MKNAFLLTVLAAALLVGCNEPEEAKVQANSVSPTAESSGISQLMKLAECSAVSSISEQIYTLASEGVPMEDIQSAVFEEVTETDGPVYGLLQNAIKITATEVARMADDPTQIDAQLSTMSRLWSAEVFKLCTSDQL